MQRTQIILVAAPEAELLRSIVFALEADGFAVESHLSLYSAVASPKIAEAACVVVDENALDGQASVEAMLGAIARPVVVLVDQLRVIPRLEGIRVLKKPLLGQLLIETAKSAIADRAAAAT